ncbi:MAG: hypothetical protein ACJAT4_002216 [Granulosicoccus sp.]|jgi:hypothetical protein
MHDLDLVMLGCYTYLLQTKGVTRYNFISFSIKTLNNPTHIYTTPGKYLAKRYATTLESCEDTTLSNITVLVPPLASFSPLTNSICVDDNNTFATNLQNKNQRVGGLELSLVIVLIALNLVKLRREKTKAANILILSYSKE